MNSDALFGLSNAGWPVLLLDETGAIHSANAAAQLVFGAHLAQSSASLVSIWSPGNDLTAAQFIASGDSSARPNHVRLRVENGSTIPVQACVSPVIENVTKYFIVQLFPDRESSETRVFTSPGGAALKQKLDCALQLARTVSLDFNNALTSILGYTSLVLSKMDANNPWRHSLMEVEKSAAKAAEIANDLGAFSRQEKETKAPQSGNLNLLLQGSAETFQKMKLDKEVAWTLRLERRLFTAKFDEAKMQQALVKILENAVESLGQSGQITLQTRNLELTEPTQDRNAQLAAGAYICAEIIDTGSGIEVDVLPRIFEPFFTTKRGGKNRGLGLAWVYGIVTNHGGAVAISSQPGTGTSVRIYLPADKKFVQENAAAAKDLNGTETILMVDDEELLLTMGQTILSSYGYTVLVAISGKKALEIFAKNECPIDLLLTDLVMPNMSGRELVEQVRQVSPFTRILCTSGFIRPSLEEQYHASYLQKPFTSRDLLLKVRQALASPEPAPVDS
jgi:two-component system cell cycle sensor histidine kinase/response regulator CckA